MRIFLDANVLFSAAKSDGAVRELLSLLIAQGHALFADAYVAEEARRNIALKAEGRSGALEKLLAQVSMVPMVGARTAVAVDLAEKDLPVIEAAVRGRCDVLVTGDKTHFGSLLGASVGGVTVLSPALLAERL